MSARSRSHPWFRNGVLENRARARRELDWRRGEAFVWSEARHGRGSSDQLVTFAWWAYDMLMSASGR